MVKRKGSYETKSNENMRGGEGTAILETLLTPEELYSKGRLFSKLTLNPGCSIGGHVHEGEMEAFYILCGSAEFSDNKKTVTLSAGDLALTVDGEFHSIKNSGETPLEFIALIIYK